MDQFLWTALVLGAWGLLLLDIWRSPLSEAPTLMWLTLAVVFAIPTAAAWVLWGRRHAATWRPRWPRLGR